MAIKLETWLYLSIFIAILFSFSVNHENREGVKATSNKELELEVATFSEVNSKGKISQAQAVSGVQENGVLSLNNVSYSGDKLELLKADKAVYDGNISTLTGNVFLKQKKGFEYTTEKAIYDINSQFVYIPNSFVAKMNENSMHGKNLKYNISKQNAVALDINAVLFTDTNNKI